MAAEPSTFLQKTDEDNAEGIALTQKGVDAYHRLVDWIKETMEGIRI